MDTGISLGRRIREVRLQKKLTQNDVVGEYMTRNMLSKIENGSAAPSVKTLEFLAQTLDVPMSYFLEGVEREAADAAQLRIIDDLARELSESDNSLLPWSLCIRARVLLAAGRNDDALNLVGDPDPALYPPQILHHVYMILEDCYREKGDYKLAYEYAVKRLEV